MTVVVVRSGGIAGLRREWRATVEGDDAVELETLIESVSWESSSIDPTSRDRFVWSITVTGSAGRHRTTVPEARLEGPLHDLVRRVQQDGEPVAPSTGRGRRAV